MNNLKLLRGEHGITQKELARKVGVTYQRISSAENGTNMSPALARKIADVLGENVFKVLGTDSFVIEPVTTEDKEILCALLREKN